MRARRKWLVVAALAFSAVGVFGVARLFGGALGLPANAGEKLERIDVSRLQPGHFMSLKSSRHEGWSYLVLHMHDSRFQVFVVYLYSGKMVVPDRFWGSNTAYPCEYFGPALTPGAFQSDSTIECQFPEPPSGWARRSWDLEGRSLSRDAVVEDMHRIPVHLEAGGFLVLGKSI